MPHKTMAVSWSAVFTAFSSSSVPGIEPQLDHRISQNTMELEADPDHSRYQYVLVSTEAIPEYQALVLSYQVAVNNTVPKSQCRSHS
jgi:hypothetical protein